MKNKFKAGDKIRRISDGVLDIVKHVPGMPEYDGKNFLSSEAGMVTQHHSWERQERWELLSEQKVAPVHFALESNIPPTQFFSTIVEVRARIKELSEQSDLNRDTINLYHISKVEKVELSTAITFKSLDAPKKKPRKAA